MRVATSEHLDQAAAVMVHENGQVVILIREGDITPEAAKLLDRLLSAVELPAHQVRAAISQAS